MTSPRYSYCPAPPPPVLIAAPSYNYSVSNTQVVNNVTNNVTNNITNVYYQGPTLGSSRTETSRKKK
jgi:hypothetical protein